MKRFELFHAVSCALCFALALLSAGSVSAQEAAPKLEETTEAAARQYGRAANAQNAKDFKFAVEQWEAFLKSYPNDKLTPKAQHYAGICYLQLNQFDKAAPHFEAVATKWVNVPALNVVEDAFLNLGWCHFQLGKLTKEGADPLFDKAAKTFAGMIQKFPDGKHVSQGLYFQGEALYMQNKKAEAIAPYAALVNDAKHKSASLRPLGIYALGVTHEELSKFPEAGKAYDLFIAEFPKHNLFTEIQMRKAETVLQAGIAAKSAGNDSQADPLLEDALKRFTAVEAIEGFGQKFHVVYRKALSLAKLGRALEAAKTYAQVATEFPSSTYAKDATLNAGRFYYNGESFDDAVQWLQKVVDSDPPNAAEAAHWICRVNLRNKEPQKAADLATQVLPKAGDGKWVVYLKMDQADGLYEIDGKMAESLPLYTEIVADHPDHELAPQSLYNAAFTSLQLKQYEVALGHVEQFLGKYTKSERLADTRYVAAECQLLVGKAAEAEPLFRDLIASFKDHPEHERWHVRLALALFLQDKFDTVVSDLGPLVSQLKTPSNLAEAQFLIGRSQSALNKHQESATAFEASFAADAKWVQADETLLLWSQALHKLNKTDEAIGKVDQLIASFPSSSRLDAANYRKGEYQYAKEDFAGANSSYSTVIDKWPDSMLAPFAYYGIGWCFIKTSDFPKGGETFTAMLTKHADHRLAADAKFARGMCRRQTNDFKGAAEDIAEFLSTNPNQADKCNALYEKGLAETGLKDYQAAVKTFSDVLATDPKCAVADKALYETAWAYKSDGKADEALTSFRKLAAEYVDSPLAAEAHFHDAEDLYSKDKFVDATAIYVSAKQKSKKGELQEKAVYKLGWSQYQQEKYAEALAEFKEQIGTYPDGPLAADGLFMVAESLFRLKKFDEALPAYQSAQTAIATAPKVADEVKVFVLLHGGQSAAELKKWDDANKFLEKIPTDFPKTPLLAEAYFEIGRAIQGLEKNEEAIDAYRKAADRDVGEIGARATYMVGEIYYAKKEYESAIREFKSVMYGFGGEKANEKIKNWQAYSGYEAARCYELRIADSKEPARSKLITNAKEFYNYVVTKHPTSKVAPQAKERLAVLAKLAVNVNVNARAR